MPRIGLLSDSHGQIGMTRRAVTLLRDQGAEILLHLGDVGTEGVLDELLIQAPQDGAILPAQVVFGNCDWDAEKFTRHARALGLLVAHPVGRLALPGGDLVFMHGHDDAAMGHALAQPLRYVCHGHTHIARDQRVGQIRVINPGALQRAKAYTVALLDTEKDHLQFLPLEGRTSRP